VACQCAQQVRLLGCAREIGLTADFDIDLWTYLGDPFPGDSGGGASYAVYLAQQPVLQQLIEEASGFGEASVKPGGLDGCLGEKVENLPGHPLGHAGSPGLLAQGCQGESLDRPGGGACRQRGGQGQAGGTQHFLGGPEEQGKHSFREGRCGVQNSLDFLADDFVAGGVPEKSRGGFAVDLGMLNLAVTIHFRDFDNDPWEPPARKGHQDPLAGA
jgi:hypothetical protein